MAPSFCAVWVLNAFSRASVILSVLIPARRTVSEYDPYSLSESPEMANCACVLADLCASCCIIFIISTESVNPDCIALVASGKFCANFWYPGSLIAPANTLLRLSAWPFAFSATNAIISRLRDISFFATSASGPPFSILACNSAFFAAYCSCDNACSLALFCASALIPVNLVSLSCSSIYSEILAVNSAVVCFLPDPANC